MSARAKQAKEVAASVLQLFWVDSQEKDIRIPSQTGIAAIVERALIAEHNATVEACAQIANKHEAHRDRNCPAAIELEIRALLAQETVHD